MVGVETLSLNGSNIPFIDQIVDIIVSLAEPEKIILFGSYARGDATEKSDIDLLVLKKNLENERDLSNLIEHGFFEHRIGISTDTIAMDYDRYYGLTDVIGYVYKAIDREGKIIYERF